MKETNEDKHAKFIDSDDPTFLAVKGHFEDKEEAKTYIKNLAKAIAVVFQKHTVVNLRCIGAASLNNAIKAQIIAAGEISKKGVTLVGIPSFTTVIFNGNEERTAIVLQIIEK